MTTTNWASLHVFATGCVLAVVGIGLYEAWWTAAFAVGGALVGLCGPRMSSPVRAVGIGAAASGAALLAGTSIFFLFGSLMRGGLPWLLAALGSIVAAVILVFVVRRLLRPSGPTRDIQRR
jgi:hypothetical protein